MRRTAARLLYVFPGAVIVASMVTLSVVPAAASAPPVPPAPYIIAIDAGHGGSPDNSRPDLLFDPGSVSGNGLLEKDLTLDIARRVQHRLEADRVKVVMTRRSDKFVSIPDRMTAATNAGAQLFVSIHFNFFQDPSVGGTVVLYPRESDKTFAQVLASAMAQRMGHFQVTDGGLMLRDNLWGHAPMPAATVEAAYLTNKNEAQLLTTDSFKEAIAAGIATGITTQEPGIATRKAQILKYEAAEAARASAAERAAKAIVLPSMPSMPRVPLLQLVTVVAMAYLLVRFRRQTIPALAFAIAIGSVVHARATGRGPGSRTRRGVRRRRSRAPIWTGARPY